MNIVICIIFIFINKNIHIIGIFICNNIIIFFLFNKNIIIIIMIFFIRFNFYNICFIEYYCNNNLFFFFNSFFKIIYIIIKLGTFCSFYFFLIIININFICSKTIIFNIFLMSKIYHFIKRITWIYFHRIISISNNNKKLLLD